MQAVPSLAFAQDFLNSREIAAVRSCSTWLRDDLEALYGFTLQKELGIAGDLCALKKTWHFMAKMNKKVLPPCESSAAIRVYTYVLANQQINTNAQIVNGLMPMFIGAIKKAGAVFSRPTGKNEALVPAQRNFHEVLSFLLQYPEFRLKLNKMKKLINELITMHYYYNNTGSALHKNVHTLRKIRRFPGFQGPFEIFNGKRGGMYTVNPNDDSKKKIYV